ncbi:cellulose synthase subunit BcsC-related outer membrane protein [Roseomonas marmotae]|uniref:BCSC C-terminal domain-containing protein n=1 Tax=Roseomonas marmotae TaxID=2768161 RepID=A0ABS3KG22_9PROT|nr:cellulose synthase subunit BcsC-related outer membrane protein [Roseomonas marmotae]MBO1075917.1 BCSC C-terminal domain-containing protein [Roseomonas marmotae]QTI81900.1 BCSC C-terminal domain-containing protein [Roseomonas marmotae]
MTQASQQRASVPPAETSGCGRGAPVLGAVLGSLILGGTAVAQAPVPDPAPSTAASTAATPAGPASAVTTLAEQMEFWSAQNRPELAYAAAERLLAISPRDPDVLAGAAEIAIQLGRGGEAESHLAMLRRVAPNDPRIPLIERQRSFTEADRAALEEARALARSGRAAEAVARYRALFPNGAFPGGIAEEYYRALASIDFQNFREAVKALSAMVQRDPDNPRLQLTLAQIQTLRETTRFTGIETLTRLTRNPQVSAAARSAWRDALLWEGPSGELITAIEAYLAANPPDAQIQAKLQEARSSLPDAATQARLRGFDLLQNKKDVAAAEKEFQESLAQRPDEASALAGLGLVRLQQGRLQEARQLRDRAVAAAPDRRQELVNMFDRLGFADLAAGQVQQAERTFQETLAASPEDATALAGLGLVRVQQKKLEEGRELRDRAIALAPARTAEFASMFVGLAYSDMHAGQLAKAEQGFQMLLDVRPEDVDGLAGMAYLRQRQGRLAEARQLRDRALSQAGPRRAEVASMLSGIGGGGISAGPAPNSPSAQARQALGRGDLERADQLARRAAQGNAAEQVAAETILGQIALRRGDLNTAEGRFRAALARQPRLPEAAGGLYDVLLRQNRFAEAEALQRETGFNPAGGTGAQRAYALRDEASRSNDPAVALALLTQARDLDPKNPWARLDLVRLLRNQGRADAAAREEQDLAALGTPDASYAAALLAQEEQRHGEVITRLEAIPNRLRNADANRLLTQARQEQEIARLEGLARTLPRSDAMQRLIALASRPDPSGTMAPGVVRALGRLRQPEAAAQAARLALALNRNASVDARIQLAGALLSAQQVEEAEALTSNILLDGKLTEEQRRQILALSAGSAVVESGQLSAEGNQQAALARLQPALQQMPENASVNLALARVYLASNRPDEAQAIADAALARSPGSLEALAVAADAALARRDWQRADALLQEGRGRYPAEPQIMLLDARVARARGDQYRALRSLEGAGVRRHAQLQAAGGRGGDAALLAARLRSSASETPAGAEIADPVAAQIATELAAARQETATWVQGGVGLRTRSGESGLSELAEVTAPVEVSAAMPGIGGRVAARAEVATLSAGTINGSLNSMRQFGTNPLAGGSTAGMVSPSGRASGVALNVNYAYGDLKADVGTTPLGFRRSNVIGGIEYAPALTDRLRLRAVGERRALNDSVLSYAGLRDDRSGLTWGGVASSGGRAQLEYTIGDAVLYGGGGYATIDGHRVAGNSRFDLGGGIGWTVLRQPDQELMLGFDVRYAEYEKNLRYFTLGHGGYFSPQSYVAAVVQADWRKQIGDLRLRLGGALGWQNYHEDDSPVFPTDPALQGQLAFAAAGDGTLNSRYPSRDGSGAVGSLRAEAEYNITPQLRIGAYATYDRAGDWNQATGMVRLRYALEQPGPELTGFMLRNTALR